MKKQLKLLRLCFMVATATAQNNTSLPSESLEGQLEKCRQQRLFILKQYDSRGCIAAICTLSRRLNTLEAQEKNSVPSTQLICALQNCNTTTEKQKLESSLKKSDAIHKRFNEKYHHELSAIEREIANQTNILWDSIPRNAKQELRELARQLHDLEDQLGSETTHIRHHDPLELLFI